MKKLVIGWLLRIIALPLFILWIYSAITEDLLFSIKAFFLPVIGALMVGNVLISKSNFVTQRGQIRDIDAFAAVAIAWPVVIFFGSLPFWFGGTFYGPSEFSFNIESLDDLFHGLLYSIFESVSGFTTTGATVIDSNTSPICSRLVEDCIASQPGSILLWRSLTQWLGGMGVIMLGILLISNILGNSSAFARAELTGPTMSMLGTNLQSTARRLWIIYFTLTILEIVALKFIGHLPLFDSVNYALTTLPTGGFGVSDGGVMDIKSNVVRLILATFMILAGVNFSLYYIFAQGKFSDIVNDEELRMYFSILILSTLTIALNVLIFEKGGFFEGLRELLTFHGLETIDQAFFQATSIGTSTGFASTDFSAWPVYSHLVLILLMVVGACAGSTGGGIKVLRVKISLELIKIEIQKYMSPRKVFAIRINDDVIQENRVWLVLGMISSWFVLATFSVLILSLVHPDWTLETVVSVVFSSLGNTGPALGQYGPTQTWSGIGDFSMIWTMMLMWIGRLEILTVLVLIHPKTWIG